MKALIYKTFGPPEVLEWVGDREKPMVNADQVLVKVLAGSVNPKDVMLRKGKFSRTLARAPLPRVSGMDMAGEVVETGENIREFKVGDLVFGMTNRFSGGVHSEFALFEADEIALAPANISVIEASCVPLSAQTALQALRDLGRVQKEDRVLIIGASGGVGHFAVQIAKILGAEIHAVCGSANMDFVSSLGANIVHDYKIHPASEIDMNFHCVFDVFGTFSKKDFHQQLGKTGVFVSTVPRPLTLFGEALAQIGIDKRSRLVNVKSCTSDLNQLCEWIELKKLVPYVETIYPVTQAKDAHKHVESRHTRGKVVLSF